MASVTACFSSPHCTSATKVLATQPMHHDSGATHSKNKPFALTCVCATRMGSQTGNLQHPFVFISRGAPQCTATAQMVSSTCIQQAKQACSIYQYYISTNTITTTIFCQYHQRQNLHPDRGAAAPLLQGSTAAVTTWRLMHMQRQRLHKSAAQKHLTKTGMNAKRGPKTPHCRTKPKCSVLQTGQWCGGVCTQLQPPR